MSRCVGIGSPVWWSRSTVLSFWGYELSRLAGDVFALALAAYPAKVNCGYPTAIRPLINGALALALFVP